MWNYQLTTSLIDLALWRLCGTALNCFLASLASSALLSSNLVLASIWHGAEILGSMPYNQVWGTDFVTISVTAHSLS